MKKYILMMLLSACVFSCQKAEFIPESDSADIDFHASIEPVAATKTSIGQDNGILWSEGDQVLVFRKTDLGVRYQIKDQYVGTSKGSFSEVAGSADAEDQGSVQELKHNVALYPYSSSVRCVNDGESYELNVLIPETQIYAEGSFAEGSFPMVAVSSGNNLSFKNICGGLKLQFKGVDKIMSITLEGLAEEPLCGESVVTAYSDGSDPTVIVSSTGAKNVTLDCGDGVQLDPDSPTSFIISLPPVSFTTGMKITVTDADGLSRTLTNTSENTIRRSSILTFPVITYTQDGVFELPEGSLTSFDVQNDGGDVEIPLITNETYDVVIPQSAGDWITMIGTKALREETLILRVAKNNTVEARSAEVQIVDSEGVTLQSIMISQKAGELSEENVESFNENQYIVYEDNYQYVPSGDSFWGMRPFFKSRVSSIQEIELKFNMSSDKKAYLFYSERPYVNNGAFLTSEGLVLCHGNTGYDVVNNKTVITWEQMGVSPTDKIVLNISLSKGLVTVNGKEIPISGIDAFTDIGYLFSSYYYDNDDGYAKKYDTVPADSRLYYVKIWNTSGSLVYFGYASQGEYSAGQSQYAWKSHYQGDTYYEYHRTNFENEWVYQYSSVWKHFGGGTDAGDVLVSSVYLDITNLDLSVGDTYTFVTDVEPFYATDKTLSWTSSDPDVASVDQNGLVTGLAAGNATITVTAAGGASASCNVKVSGAAGAFIDLSEDATSNCYIVSEAGSYGFLPVKGNSSDTVGEVASAEVVWETYGTFETPTEGCLISSASYSDGYVCFETAETYKEGNALIAAKDASGKILWSWHIWLTDMPQAIEYRNDAGSMMDRNLGATSVVPGDACSHGLLYQWGRKDPFLGSPSTSISSSGEMESTYKWPAPVGSDSSTGTIAYATEHPTTFITCNTSNYDWYYTGSYDTDQSRWQSVKTVYDPCLSGWRVPDGGSTGVWATADFENAYRDYLSYRGFTISVSDIATSWYPITGWRDVYDGTLKNAPYDTYLWSVSPSSVFKYEASAMYIVHDSAVDSDHAMSRSIGASVRCMKE